MALKKKHNFIDLTMSEEDTCKNEAVDIKEFWLCTCVEAVSISLKNVTKQPADSSTSTQEKPDSEHGNAMSVVSVNSVGKGGDVVSTFVKRRCSMLHQSKYISYIGLNFHLS